MEKSYELSTNSYLCYLEKEPDAWITGRVTLDCPIDRGLLQRAADDTLQAMPVLSARKAVAPEGDRYVLNADGQPLRVRDHARAEEPDGRESGALVDISFEGSTLIVNVSHALTDGCGFVAILEHLVTRYLCRRWEELPEPAQALGQPSPYDYADPLEALPDPQERFDFEYPDAEFFEAGDLDPDGIQYFALDCDERRIEDLAREAEGSFSGVLAGVLGSALKNCKPESGTLVITCPMDMRGILGCTRTLQNCNQSMHYVFPPAIWKYPFQQRLSMLKAQLYLQRSGEYCLPRFLEWRAQIRSLSAIPSVSGKAASLRALMRPSPYPIVSCLGEISFGKEMPHVKGLRLCYPVAGNAGLLLVAYRFGGRCRVDISSSVRGSMWLEQFRRVLTEAGVQNEQLMNT